MPLKGYRKGNEIILNKDNAILIVKNKNGEIFNFIIDLDDIDRIKKHT